MTYSQRLRVFYDDRRKKGPGLIALAIVGIINWIVSDVLSFSALVSQLDIDLSGFKQVANVLLPEFGLFGTLFVVALICWLLAKATASCHGNRGKRRNRCKFRRSYTNLISEYAG